MTTPDQDKARKAQEEAIMLEFLEAKKVFSRDPLDFRDKDKNKIDDRVEGGGYSGNVRPKVLVAFKHETSDGTGMND